MTPIRIGVIGVGKIARDQHLPAIAADPMFELAATVDRSAPPSVMNYLSHEDLLKHSDRLDAVVITTPPGPRYKIACDCIAAGLDVLLEKPPAASLGEIEDLRKRAAAAKRTLFASWHAQYNPSVSAAAKILLDTGIRSVNITWHEDVEKWHPGQSWIWRAGGFGVFDPGINALSIATAILSDPLFVREAALYFPAGADTPIAADIRLASPSVTGELHCSFDWRRTTDEEWVVEVITANGSKVSLREGGARLTVDGVEQAVSSEGEYPRIYKRFLDLIHSGQSDVATEPLRLVEDCFLMASRHVVD